MMTQTWHDLLFAHWPVSPSALRASVPRVFDLDLFHDQAWLSIVPFHMTNVAPRGVPSLPGISEFPELNVRTYVRRGGRAGVYFFSLDAGSVLAVKAARLLLNLPYHVARMTVSRTADVVTYRSARASPPIAEFKATYGPTGPRFIASEGTLEYFLTERYCLYHTNRAGSPYRLEIHHPPWSLQSAQAEILLNTMAPTNGIGVGDDPALVHFVHRQDVVAWRPTRLID